MSKKFKTLNPKHYQNINLEPRKNVRVESHPTYYC